MVDRPLTARSALGSRGPMLETWPDFTLRENADLAVASLAALRDRLDDLLDRARTGLAIDLPPPRSSASNGSVRALWAGHEQWLIEANRAEVGDLPGRLQEAVGDAAAITDQSDAWVNICIEGARTRAVLEKLCPLDLHPRRFPPGSTARTNMAHLSAIITLHDDGKCFSLLVARSSARSFLDHLRHAANSDRASASDHARSHGHANNAAEH